MPRDGAQTRERILAAAADLVVERGFGATTINAVLEASSTTKGAFFHHFESKSALGRALVERYAAQDVAMLEGLMAEPEAASDDHAEQVLSLLTLL